jgi:LysM repeat protein
MKVSLRLFFIFYFLSAFSFVLPAQKKERAFVDYINQYSDLAVKYKKKYNVPASITLAQGVLETNAGRSELVQSSNNHFGIKCHSDWTGGRIYRKDDIEKDCFRVYNNAEESYKDHGEFLLQHSRYSVLFTYDLLDYRSWAKGLQACGYATNPGYANGLIRIIEEYELYRYDTKTPFKSSSSKKKAKPVLLRDVYKTYNMLYVIAKAGDSFDRIADDTGFKVKDLIKYNEVPEDFPLRKGDIVYLEKKKKKADKPYFEYLVKVGDSMHSISQKYGIRLKNLYKMNKKDPNYAPTEGEVLRLR